ncbi:nuclear transport factor 2 family protein [Variovorax sp. J22R133]|uniref:nuclear transport factor 2 family protein n=1 Tax=Variovorax brevis TaxID=3053503 RepID=UPI00257669B8|nr:nuclear transport factor 2 family protein [Variovorax sp. J22R133]MDM0110774.1 nuclear transport factor 2 family protein [Variovorax sp. J22R133]
MQTQDKTLIDLETRFWQSMVDQNTDAALAMLNEPAVMVSAHGAFSFDHAGYRKLAEQGTMLLTSFELSDMDVVYPNDKTAILTYHVKQGVSARGKSGKGETQDMVDSSTWVRSGDGWRCVMHTETPAGPAH